MENKISTISWRGKDLNLKSYLINNKKNIDITSYDNLINENVLDNNNYQISIYTNFKSAIEFINPIINKFDKSFLEELNHYLNKNILFLNSNEEWIIVFENNTQNKFYINNIKKLKVFNKSSLENNNNIYSIYSQDILEEEENIIKQIAYKDIYTVESENFTIVSNNLINAETIDFIAKEFLNLRKKTDEKNFLYQKIDIKGSNPYKSESLSTLKDLNFLFENIINFSNNKFLQVLKQSIPDKEPILYTELSFKLFS